MSQSPSKRTNDWFSPQLIVSILSVLLAFYATFSSYQKDRSQELRELQREASQLQVAVAVLAAKVDRLERGR